MKKKQKFHLNDKTLKYSSAVLSKLQHEYLGLPGTYETRYPNEVVLPNMESGRMDELYSVEEGILINLEEESDDITENTLLKFAKYRTFTDYIYGKYLYTAVISKKNPKNFPKEYELTKTNIIRPHYIYFPPEELWKKYENLIKKIKQKEELSKREILDITFVAKYMPKKDAPFITESIANMFKYAIIKDKKLKMDITAILGAIILRDIKNEEKQTKLLEEIGMAQVNNEIRRIFKEEFKEIEQENQTIKKEKDTLKQENQTIKKEKDTLKQENQTLKQGLEKLNKLNNLSPEAKKIINSLIP